MKKKKSDLNVKQQLFVKHYLMSFNQKKAAIAAGYSERTADSQGSRLLTNVKVEKMINDEMARLRERMSDDANRIYAGLWQEVNELSDRINEHYQGEKAVKSLQRDKHALLFGSQLDTEEELNNDRKCNELRIDYIAQQDLKRQLREINFKIKEAQLDIMKDRDFLRSQEIRAKLLHDLFDRAGYKPTDKIDLKHQVSGGLDLSYMSDEELEKEAAKI